MVYDMGNYLGNIRVVFDQTGAVEQVKPSMPDWCSDKNRDAPM